MNIQTSLNILERKSPAVVKLKILRENKYYIYLISICFGF